SENDDWEIDIIVDPLTGETEFSKKIYARTEEYLQENEWDYLISITDLPLFYNDKPVVIDIDTSDGIAMMSIPAFGWRPLKRRVQTAIINIASMIKKIIDNGDDIEAKFRRKFTL